MEDDFNGRQHQWKTTQMEDKLNERWPQWKVTSIKANLVLSLAQLSPSLFWMISFHRMFSKILSVNYTYRLFWGFRHNTKNNCFCLICLIAETDNINMHNIWVFPPVRRGFWIFLHVSSARCEKNIGTCKLGSQKIFRNMWSHRKYWQNIMMRT